MIKIAEKEIITAIFTRIQRMFPDRMVFSAAEISEFPSLKEAQILFCRYKPAKSV